MKTRTYALAALTTLALASCAKGGGIPGLGGIEKYLPTVKFDKFNVKDLSFEKIDTVFVFDVHNNVPIKIPLGSFSWNLDLADNSFLKGDNKKGFTLEPNAGSKLRIPVTAVFKDLIAAIAGLTGKDTVPFALHGKMGFDTPLGEIKLPYQSHGDFPVLRIPKFQIAKLRVDKLDLLGHTAKFALDLTVSHEQASVMKFLEFDYAFKLGGKSLVKGMVHSLADVPAGTTEKVTIPIDIDLLAAGATIVSAITNHGKMDVGLDANMNVATPFGDVPLKIANLSNLKIE